MHHDNKQSSVQENMEGQELETYINKAIDQLPEKCRMVFVLSRFEQLSYKEVAAKLGISTKTVENQISKALKHLRTAIYDRNNIFENN
jgi:RNA polymerase sigma-70 factor (ECF subfamily)